MASDEEGSICEFVVEEKHNQLVLVEVQVGIRQSDSVHDLCRLCNKNLRIKGIIAHSALLFAPKPPLKSLSDRIASLGLVLKPDKNKSRRVCRKCENVVGRMERDILLLRKWKENEQEEPTLKHIETPSNSPPSPAEPSPELPREKRARSPSPSDLLRPKKKLRKIPNVRGRSSVTQVITSYTSKTVVKEVSSYNEALIINRIANQNWKTAAYWISAHEDLFHEVKLNFLTAINEQCRSLVNRTNGFMLWKTSPDDVKSFSFDNLVADLERMSPFLLSIFNTISSDNQDTACAALCIALRGRMPHMSAFAYHINGIVSRDGLKKAMLNRLSKMSITTSYRQAKRRQDELKVPSGAASEETTAEREPLAEPLINSDAEKCVIARDSDELGAKETDGDHLKS